jgi:hypothetical protein
MVEPHECDCHTIYVFFDFDEKRVAYYQCVTCGQKYEVKAIE